MSRLPKIKVVILGAGYGGLITVKNLQKHHKYNEMDITLVNKHDYHYITTHLHTPAAGTDHHNNSRVWIRELVKSEKVNFIKSTVTGIIPEAKKVLLTDGELDYDYLVIGLGSEVETFGIPGLKEYALSIRSINSVRFIRQHIEYMFAKYKLEPDRKEYITFVVGGAGFTGTEFVGELADRIPVLCKEYDVDPSEVKIYNVEASPAALPPGLPYELVEYGMKVLRAKGVTYKLSTPIKACTPDGVLLADGEFIPSLTVIWSGGIRGNGMLEQSGFEAIRGRVKVDEYLRSLQYPNVFVTGDCSLVIGPDGRPYPPTAQIAMQQGNNVARNLIHLIKNEPLEVFNYDHKGTVTSLGKGEAVGLVKSWKIKGKIAALMKLIIDARYLFIIGGFKLVLRKAILK